MHEGSLTPGNGACIHGNGSTCCAETFAEDSAMTIPARLPFRRPLTALLLAVCLAPTVASAQPLPAVGTIGADAAKDDGSVADKPPVRGIDSIGASNPASGAIIDRTETLPAIGNDSRPRLPATPDQLPPAGRGLGDHPSPRGIEPPLKDPVERG